MGTSFSISIQEPKKGADQRYTLNYLFLNETGKEIRPRDIFPKVLKWIDMESIKDESTDQIEAMSNNISHGILYTHTRINDNTRKIIRDENIRS